MVGALPIGVFTGLLNLARRRVGPVWAMCLAPVLWTGIEFFRSEVWSLRFAWLLPGQVVAPLPGVRMASIGVYGLGFLFMAIAALVASSFKWPRLVGVAGTLLVAILMYVPTTHAISADVPLHVAGLQTEFWEVGDIVPALDRLATEHPEAQLLVLNEC